MENEKKTKSQQEMTSNFGYEIDYYDKNSNYEFLSEKNY